MAFHFNRFSAPSPRQAEPLDTVAHLRDGNQRGFGNLDLVGPKRLGNRDCDLDRSRGGSSRS
jgi:hypothetical protein